MRIEASVIKLAAHNFSDGTHYFFDSVFLRAMGATEKQIRRYRQSGKFAKLSSVTVAKIHMLARITDQATAKTLLKAIEAKYKK